MCHRKAAPPAASSAALSTGSKWTQSAAVTGSSPILLNFQSPRQIEAQFTAMYIALNFRSIDAGSTGPSGKNAVREREREKERKYRGRGVALRVSETREGGGRGKQKRGTYSLQENEPLLTLKRRLFSGPHIAPEMIIIVQIPTVLPAIHIINCKRAVGGGRGERESEAV